MDCRPLRLACDWSAIVASTGRVDMIGRMSDLSADVEPLVRYIQASGRALVLAVTGGGTRAIADLLSVPGASRLVLEAIVPYSEPALTRFLGGKPDHFCSPPAARAMAMAAYHRATENAPAPRTICWASPARLAWRAIGPKHWAASAARGLAIGFDYVRYVR